MDSTLINASLCSPADVRHALPNHSLFPLGDIRLFISLLHLLLRSTSTAVPRKVTLAEAQTGHRSILKVPLTLYSSSWIQDSGETATNHDNHVTTNTAFIGLYKKHLILVLC